MGGPGANLFPALAARRATEFEQLAGGRMFFSNGGNIQNDLWADWWFGTFFIFTYFPYIGNLIPIDECCSEGLKPPTSGLLDCLLYQVVPHKAVAEVSK